MVVEEHLDMIGQDSQPTYVSRKADFRYYLDSARDFP